jgi:ribosomal protein L36
MHPTTYPFLPRRRARPKRKDEVTVLCARALAKTTPVHLQTQQPPQAAKPAPTQVNFAPPPGAKGTFLRVVQVNDVYKLENYPPLAEFLRRVRADAKEAKRDCKIVSVNNGDFLSPCIITSLDAGFAMMDACNQV